MQENCLFSKIKYRRQALGGTDPCLRDAKSGATGGLGSEGRDRGVEHTCGTGGSPRLRSGNSGGNNGSSGSSGGSAGGGSRPGSDRTLPSTGGTFLRMGSTYVPYGSKNSIFEKDQKIEKMILYISISTPLNPPFLKRYLAVHKLNFLAGGRGIFEKYQIDI